MALTKVNTDLLEDGGKLDGIEAGADVTDTTNVTAAGALMDSELTSEASVKALNQGVATTDSPTFAGLNATGDLTLDVAGDIILDADDEGKVNFKDGGTQYARIDNNGGTGLDVVSTISDGDIRFRGNDGGSTIEALTLDMSDAGAATFNDLINIGGSSLNFTKVDGVGINAKESLSITIDSDNNDASRVFNVLDGNGTTLMQVTDAGEATFNQGAVFNEAGVDSDFRVESNNNTHALFVDGASGNVSIGSSTAYGTSKLSLFAATNPTTASSSAIQLSIGEASQNSSYSLKVGYINIGGGYSSSIQSIAGGNPTTLLLNADGGNVGIGTSNPVAQFAVGAAGRRIEFDGGSVIRGFDRTASWAGIDFEASAYTFDCSTARMLDIAATGVIINEDSADADFRVESNNNANMLFVDGGNNQVGVGTASALGASLNVLGGITNSTMYDAMVLTGGANSTSGSGARLYISGTANDPISRGTIIEGKMVDNGNTHELSFYVSGNSAVPTRRMTIGHGAVVINEDSLNMDFRVESNGYSHMLFVDAGASIVAFGQTQNIAGGGMYFNHGNNTKSHLVVSNTETSYSESLYYGNRQNSDGHVFQFRRQNYTVGNIYVDSNGTTYNTTSDRRLKKDIETITDGTDKLMAMNPVTHGWKADPEADTVHGFIAQEMLDIVPEAVSGDPEGEDMMSMDYGRITPVIVAALQEANKKIAELENRINDLEGK